MHFKRVKVEIELGYWEYLWLVLGGLAAGIINTLAGNGSAITLSLLMWMGLPAGWANATNRIGVVFQTITAVVSLPKTERNRSLRRSAYPLFIPSIIGAALGAWLADETPDTWLRYVIGVVMIFLLFTLLFKPSRWKAEPAQQPQTSSLGLHLYFFAFGLYAGYIQMGIGIMMLAVLVLYARYGLVEANIIKLIMALVFIVPAFFVFLAAGKMHWPSGIALGAGQMAGAWIGTRYFLTHPLAALIIRYVLTAVLIVAILRIFNVTSLIFG